jgi:hypothetical protein
MSNPDRRTCITNFKPFYLTYSKKEDGIKQIVELFNVVRNAIPKTTEFHRYYQNYALRLLQSIIYVGNKTSLRKNPKRSRQQTEPNLI